jgi:hypothetical protein
LFLEKASPFPRFAATWLKPNAVVCKKPRIGQNPQLQAIDGGIYKRYRVVRRVAGDSVGGFGWSEARRPKPAFVGRPFQPMSPPGRKSRLDSLFHFETVLCSILYLVGNPSASVAKGTYSRRVSFASEHYVFSLRIRAVSAGAHRSVRHARQAECRTPGLHAGWHASCNSRLIGAGRRIEKR